MIADAEYKRFSKAAGLRLQHERANVPGFGPKQHGVAEKVAINTLESNSKDNKPLAKAYSDDENRIEWPSKSDVISAEKYKELRSYAESKGVFLQGFKNSDIDLSLATETIDEAAKMLDQYPELYGSMRKPFTLYLDRHMQSVDFAEVKDGTPHILHLNSDAYRSKDFLQKEYKKLADEGGFVKGTSYKSVIYHEIGHMVSDVYKVDGQAVMKEVLNTDSTAQTLLWCKHNLSEYSFKEDGSEIISEVFSAFYGGSEPSKEVVDFMTRCDKIITDRRG